MMHSYRSAIFSLILLVFFNYSAQAQGIDSMMGVYAQDIPQQKVYVHFDKSVYRPGETIWFKAYLFAGFEPSAFSRNFFAELVDSNGLVVQRKIYPVVEASAAGNFDIPETQNRNLVFRAYTTWMLNFDTAFLYRKEITILNANTAGSIKAAPSPTTLTLFPEGGDLVNDLESMVAFKANNNKGKPAAVKGEIKNKKGDVVATFASEHGGMGTFAFTPAAGETYTASYTDAFGVSYSVPLPAAKASGLGLHITPLPGKAIFIVRQNSGSGEPLKMVNVVAHLAQQIIYKAKVPLSDVNINSGAIPTSNLPSGILQVTVFNDRWEPLAERVVFVNNNNYQFGASLATPVINLQKRSKNVFELHVEDTLLANMSVAVTDAEIGRATIGDNIISGLLLSGDLKGYIDDPAYYFKNTADTTAHHLDLVMLTHGWRKYNWQNMARGRKPFLKYPTDPALALVGKVFGVNPSSPIQPDESMTVILQSKDSSTQIFQVPKTGPTEFALRNFIFYDTLKVFYQFEKDRKLAANTSLLFENGLYKGPRMVNVGERPQIPVDSLTIKRSNFFAEQLYRFGEGRVNVLQEVIVKTRVKAKADELDKKYASGLFAGGDAITFDFLNDKTNAGFQNIFQYLQGRVPGLQINNNGSDVSLLWRGSQTSTFLNEMRVDPQTLATIPVTDIAYIKVFRPPFFGAMGGGAGGAIAIYTRKGNDQPMDPGKGLPRGMVSGYSIMKQFYSPDYSNLDQEVTADFRTTLYWNPFVFTDADKRKATFEFYNNDVSKALRVIVEGVNEYGKLIRIEKVIQ